MKFLLNAKNLIIPFLFLPFVFAPALYQNKATENIFSSKHFSFITSIEKEITTNYSIEEIETGTSHSGAIINNKKTNTDELYTWGLNDQGQLGIGNNNNSNYPQKVNGLPKGDLSNLSMGDKHSAVVVSSPDDQEVQSDELYIWGDNTNGQLGLGDKGTYEIIDPDDGSKTEENISYFNTPQYLDWTEIVPEDINQKEMIIKDVSLGTQYSAAVVSYKEKGSIKYNDYLYTWGENDSGKLGNSYHKEEETPYYNVPQEISELPEGEIKDISMGKSHSAAIVKNNQKEDYLYSWGSNGYGQLGDPNATNNQGDHPHKYSPIKIYGFSENSNIEQISMNYNSSSAIIKNNDNDNDFLYTWGSNANGQLGVGTSKNIYQPQKVEELPSDENIKEVSMGYEHTAVVTTDIKGNDHLYTWGKNDKGQLGLETLDNPDSDPPINYYSTPQEVTNLPKGNISNISMGKDYSMVIVNSETKNNDYLYVWGDNEFGQLGLGYNSEDPVLIPKMWVKKPKTFTEKWYFYLILAITVIIVILVLTLFIKLFRNRKIKI